MGGRKKSGPPERGPEDDYEALRAQFLKALRRSPGDTRALMRIAGSLSRMAAAEGRKSAKSREELTINMERILARFGNLIVPPDGPG